jgi:DNA-binding IclR family transcriptional regulator
VNGHIMEAILRILRAGERSGPEMAKQIGVTRGCVHQSLQRLARSEQVVRRLERGRYLYSCRGCVAAARVGAIPQQL